MSMRIRASLKLLKNTTTHNQLSARPFAIMKKKIGLKLFKRSKNGMEALPGTEPIFEELMHIRSANTRIDQIVSNINNLDSGFIRIGTVQSIAYNWLPGVLKNFSAEYPNITFQLYVDGFQNLTKKLRKKELDCIFVSQYVAKDFPNLPVGTDELVLVTSLDHPLADQLTVSFADIDGQDFVLSADDFDYETGKLFRLNHITPNVRFRINEDYTAIKWWNRALASLYFPNFCFIIFHSRLCPFLYRTLPQESVRSLSGYT